MCSLRSNSPKAYFKKLYKVYDKNVFFESIWLKSHLNNSMSKIYILMKFKVILSYLQQNFNN